MIEILGHSSASEAIEPARTRDLPAVAVLSRRAVPLAFITLMGATTMVFTMVLGPLITHHPYWIIPGDIWGTFRTSQFVAWGDIGNVYSSGGGLVSLPGISVVLAPAALIVNHFGMSVGFPVGIPHPSSWLVLGPYEAVIGSVVLIPLDSLAEDLGLNRGVRLVSTACEAVVLWPVIVIWGHPEDSLAMAFAIWGLIAAFRGRWRTVGWLWGLALVTQPLVVLMVPIVFALAPRREWLKLLARSVLPSAALVAIPLAQSWPATTTALVKQPNYPLINHATPWLSLAPVLSKAQHVRTGHIHQTTLADGATHFTVRLVQSVAGESVAAGPGRMIAIGLAVLLGVYVYRHRPPQRTIVWLCCVALSLRCVFEAVMVPYYLWPPLAIGFVLVVQARWRLALAVSAATLATYWSYRHLGPWEWWVPIVVLLGLVVAAAHPASSSAPGSVYFAETSPLADGLHGHTSQRAIEALV